MTNTARQMPSGQMPSDWAPPPRPEPSQSTTRRPPHQPRVGIVAWVLLIIVILAGSTALLAPYVMDYFAVEPGPEPIHIENRFMDIDNDGDDDFVQQADVLLNCGGALCLPTPLPAQPTPAQPALAPASEQATPAGEQLAPPTPPVTPPPDG